LINQRFFAKLFIETALEGYAESAVNHVGIAAEVPFLCGSDCWLYADRSAGFALNRCKNRVNSAQRFVQLRINLRDEKAKTSPSARVCVVLLAVAADES
jgi:hypothetical protein